MSCQPPKILTRSITYMGVTLRGGGGTNPLSSYGQGSSQQQPLPSYNELAYMSLFGSTNYGEGYPPYQSQQELDYAHLLYQCYGYPPY
ncbi:hypothetical protein QVD17_28331 [Tagetes erecta]|uniref:Uncharacterized protein n=1 Tax=Tagetes erecta TaxID=13708 RepID=A0AAD8KDL9_TARER|nr:hypothetical protein QVD17_28331 [Tagetes erecta]